MYPAILPGTLLHQRYHVIGILAQGQLGWMYLAEDQKRTGELCVLRELLPSDPTPDRLKALQEAFLQEAALLYELHHPQIPRFRVIFADEGRLFWVEEHIPGKAFRTLLNDRLAQGVAFSEIEVVQLLWQVLPVLSYIHSRGVVHGNISPDSLVWRDRDQLPVLIDFGSVYQIVTKLGLLPGQLTPSAYVPADAEGHLYSDPSVDLYALAVTVLVLLTGQEPHNLYDEATQTWQWQQWVEISPRLSSILRQLLLRRNKLRHPSAEQIARTLKPLLNSPTLPSTESTVSSAPIVETAAAAVTAPDEDTSLPTEIQPKVKAKPPKAKPTGRVKRGKSKYPQAAALLGLSVVLISGAFAWEMLASVRKDDRSTPTASPKNSPQDVVIEAPASNPTPQVAVQSTPTPQRSPSQTTQNEPSIQAMLRDRRRQLDISYDFFVDLVDEAFYTRYPDLKGQRLSSNPQQAQLRITWSGIAEDLLDRLALFSQPSRSKLGKYSRADYERGVAIAKQFNLSDRGLQTLTNVRFNYLFPEQKGRNLDAAKFGQVWLATLDEQLKAIQSKTALENIQLGAQGTQRSGGVLKPGQGKVYVVYLQQNQAIQLNLQAPSQSTRLSLYPPAQGSGANPLLQDSPDLKWSGTVPQTGYYEVVIVSFAPETVGYQLQLQGDL
jgi:serine/threonine protein kinase, bacterial